MLKYLTHKLRTQSINDEHPAPNEKIDGHDSGTESDGDLDQEDDLIQEHDMELSLSSRQDTASPTDTACSSESPAFLGAASHLLMYDQNSSEEELEVINGGILELGSRETDGDGGGVDGCGGSTTDSASGVDLESSANFNRLATADRQSLAEVSFNNTSDDIDDCTDELCLATSPVAGTLRPLAITPTQVGLSKRCSSNNLLEKRKRSLAHSSDEEVRHLLENQHQQQHHHHHHHPHHQPLMSAPPVNFRTSPPLEALKPHRGHIIQRSTTPLILTESGRGLEHIRISSSSSISSTTSSLSSLGGATAVYGGIGGGLPTCDSPAVTPGISNHHHHHHQPHHQSQNSINLVSLLSTTNTPTGSTSSSGPGGPVGMPFGGGGGGQETGGGSAAAAATVAVANMEISRSVSPPAKVFHCAVSPRRRQSRHQQQRVPRPHRPCLDFDKMQQLKARPVTTWKHNNEHSGELSVFCW